MAKRFWLSFCSPDGKTNLGVAISPGGTFEEAIQRAWSLGYNPGGSVLAHEIDPRNSDYDILEEDRLYSGRELELLQFPFVKTGGTVDA